MFRPFHVKQWLPSLVFYMTSLRHLIKWLGFTCSVTSRAILICTTCVIKFCYKEETLIGIGNWNLHFTHWYKKTFQNIFTLVFYSMLWLTNNLTTNLSSSYRPYLCCGITVTVTVVNEREMCILTGDLLMLLKAYPYRLMDYWWRSEMWCTLVFIVCAVAGLLGWLVDDSWWYHLDNGEFHSSWCDTIFRYYNLDRPISLLESR